MDCLSELKSPVFCFLKCQICVLRCSKLQILWSAVTYTKRNNKAIINSKIMATEVSLIQIISASTVFDCFVLLFFALFLCFFLLYFPYFEIFRHKKLCFLWKFHFLPEFRAYFSVFRITENWGTLLLTIQDFSFLWA